MSRFLKDCYLPSHKCWAADKSLLCWRISELSKQLHTASLLYSHVLSTDCYYFLLLNPRFLFQIWSALLSSHLTLIPWLTLPPSRQCLPQSFVENPSCSRLTLGNLYLNLLIPFSILNSQAGFTMPRQSNGTERLGWSLLRFSDKKHWSASLCPHHQAVLDKTPRSHLMPRVETAYTMCILLFSFVLLFL